MQVIELAGVFILAVLVAFASAGGIGGGEVIVPGIAILFGFDVI